MFSSIVHNGGTMLGKEIYTAFLLSYFLGVQSLPYESSLGIVGGDTVNITEAPYMARYQALGYSFFCGASIVHPRFVISSASCFYSMRHGRYTTYIVVGSDKLNTGGDAFEIEVAYPHPSFSISWYDYNIAILKLTIPLTFNERVKPIPLAKKDFMVPEGAMFDVLGFGSLSPNILNFTLPDQLQKVSISYMTPENCNGLDLQMTERLLCAGSEGKNACYLDDGGPLVHKGELLGVITSESGCGKKDYPSVFVYVPALRGFIDSIIDA